MLNTSLINIFWIISYNFFSLGLQVRKDQDAGVYACFAKNAFGEVTSKNATLDVASKQKAVFVLFLKVFFAPITSYKPLFSVQFFTWRNISKFIILHTLCLSLVSIHLSHYFMNMSCQPVSWLVYCATPLNRVCTPCSLKPEALVIHHIFKQRNRLPRYIRTFQPAFKEEYFHNEYTFHMKYNFISDFSP